MSMTQNETLTNKVVLVTGGAPSFIGSHLCDSLLRRGLRRLIVVDDFSMGKESNIKHLQNSEIVKIHEFDASDYSSISKLLDIEKSVAYSIWSQYPFLLRWKSRGNASIRTC